jgi:hypothetical protein
MYGVTNLVTEVTKLVTHERKFDTPKHCVAALAQGPANDLTAVEVPDGRQVKPAF